MTCVSRGPKPRLKMLHCAPHLTGGGAERQLVYLTAHWAAIGHEVHIAYLAGDTVPPMLKRAGVFLHPLRHHNNYDPLLLIRLIGLIRRIKPDFVQTWILQMDVLAGLAAFLTATPWLLREPANAMAWPDGLKTRPRLWIGATADMVVSNSAGGDAYWAKRRSPDRRCIVANALPLDAIASAPAERLPELPSGDPIIMYAGRLSEEKNLDVLIRALALVVTTTPVVALIFGDGPLRQSLEHLVAELGVGDRILLRGTIPTIWGTLKSAHLFISISRFEGRPNSVLEAMACRCPLIVSDIPAHRELLDDDSALFIGRYDDPDSVAEGILEALRDRAIALRRAQTAYKRIGEWSVPAVGNEYENVYAKLLGRHNDAAPGAQLIK